MAPRTPKIRLLRDKRRALDEQVVKLEAELAKLREEAKEFEIAERVLLSLGGDDEDEGGEGITPTNSAPVALNSASITTAPAVLRDPSLTEVPRKPQGIPSTPEMISIALKEMTSSAGASKTKTPLEITEFIKARWWSSATSKDISPVVWRMGNEGRLFKDAVGNYGLPRTRHRSEVENDNNAA